MVRTIGHLFFHAAERHSARTALRPAGAPDRAWTFAALADAVRETALGLTSLGIGVGDRVALIADNSASWLIADLSILSIGAIDVPRGTDTTPSEIDYLVRHSGSRVVVVQDRETLDELAPTLADIADLRTIVLLDGSYRQGDPRTVLSLDEVRERGAKLLGKGATLELFTEQLRGNDLATIVYTSGTTGRPKGVTLTHDNILHNIRAIPEVVEFTRDDVFLSILPAWHMFERLIEYAALSKGCLTVYTQKRTFKHDLLRESPTVLAAVPRLYELLYEEARKRLTEDGSWFQRTLVKSLLRASAAVRAAERVDPRTGKAPGGPGAWLRPVHALADKLIFTKFRAALGGRLRTLVSGGGSLPEHIDAFFDVAGVPILNGYGLTETAPLVAVRRRERIALRTVGPPIRDTEIQVRDGEGRCVNCGDVGVLHVRGPQVTAGYYQDREATRRAFDEHGFFDTGDLVRVHPTGDIEITGRAKDTIVLRGGENVEPEPIENALRLSPLIEQILVVGQDQKALGALIVPAKDAIVARLPVTPSGAAVEFDPEDAHVRKLVQRELERLVTREAGFKPFEMVRRFVLMTEPFSIETGELTETLKMRRHAITSRRAAELARLFDE
jgi:long-chain acyl-CoA synthetase